MPRTQSHLWARIVSFGNLLAAYRRAAQGKRSRPVVAEFEFRLEDNLLALHDDLRSGRYAPGPYQQFYVHAPKRRLIAAAPFRDRVVHHALINVIGPLFERQFNPDSYANQVGKGTHAALNRCTHYLRAYPYVLPLDIRQYFPSIDHAILHHQLARTVTDERALALCDQIMASGLSLPAPHELVYFPGDDVFAALRPRGLPIGNLTSQFWGNVYLTALDHFIKRRLRCPGYVRYVDDMLLFGSDKAQLHGWREAVRDQLAALRLTLHEHSAQPRPCRIGLPFLGFQVFPYRRRLKRRNVVNARRRLKHRQQQCRVGDITQAQLTASVRSWLGHASHGRTRGICRAVLAEAGLLAEAWHAFDRP